MKKNVRYILLTVILVVATALASGCNLFIKTSDGKADLYWYMKLTYDDESGQDQVHTVAQGENIAAVALENDYSDDFGIIKDQEVYVNVNTIIQNIDRRFYWDKRDSKVLFTNAVQVYESKIGENVIEGEKKEDTGYIISFMENDACYVNLKFVEKFTDIDYNVTAKSDKTPYIISLHYDSGQKVVMNTTRDIEMRTKGNYQNLIVKTVEKGTEVTVLENGKNWDKVRTDDGYIGYIPVKRLENPKKEKIERKNDDSEYTHVLLEKKVSLAWNQIYTQTSNSNIDTLLQKTEGINVLSPTWFSLVDKNGNLSTFADLNYVEKAHSMGIQVWALVNDFTDKKLTNTVLTSTTKRKKLVNNIMYFLNSYELDGVNIDFEYVTEEISDSYLQFLRELSVECRKARKVLSVDNYAPSQWSGYYDRKQQLKLADYIIIMNYDEHTSASEEAGSVSSLPWAEKSIKDTIKETGDSHRIINGIPFYTRVWKETAEADSDGTGLYIEDSVNGNYYLSSEAVGMKAAEKSYKSAGVKPIYDEQTGQNFVTYSVGKTTYMAWLEDKVSVRARLELMNKYNLAGSAYWALGQEKSSIWKVISEYFK